MKLKTLFTTPKRAIITSVCMLAILAAAGTATAFAAESIAKSNSIGTAAAEEKALLDAGVSSADANFGYTDFDFEKGSFVYEVEFTANGIEWEYVIKASDGTVLSRRAKVQQGYADAMTPGLDTGDMILSALTDISDEDTFETLHDRLAQMGGNLLVETIRQIEAGTAPRIPQEGPTCYAHMLHTEDRRIDFNDTVKNIVNKVRGLSPVPCAFCLCEGKKVKIYRAADAGFDRDCPIGTVVCENGCLYVKARDGFVHIQQLQAEGKKRMDDQCFLCGNHPRQFE